jgi:ABC-2 type transport system permease protein
VLPASAYGTFGDVAVWLPSGALGEGMRSAFLDGVVAWRDAAVLLGWAIVGTVLTAKTFRWE